MAKVDFNKTFAPVTKFITIRCILVIEEIVIWEIHQMDVNATFFKGVLVVDIYHGSTGGIRTRGKRTSCVQA